jgi:hypothetical protein
MAMTKKKGPLATGTKGDVKKKITGGKKKIKNGVAWFAALPVPWWFIPVVVCS